MTPETRHKAIAAAWAAWRSRHGDKLGPGPAFTEAIDAALAVILADIVTPEMEEAGDEVLSECVSASSGYGGEWIGTDIEPDAAKRVFLAMLAARKQENT